MLPTLPGQFLLTPELPSTEFLDNLHRLMDPFTPPPLVHGSSPPSGSMHLRPAFWEAGYVFVCCDGVCPSLTPLYDGPHRVVHRSDTYFPLAVGDREDSISVSRLKPLLAESPVVPAQPHRQGRPPRLKPPPEPTAVPCRRGRPRKDPPPAPPPAQLRRGRSAGLDPAHLGPQGLGGACNGSETPCNKTCNCIMIVHRLYCLDSVRQSVYKLACYSIYLSNAFCVFS